MQNQNTNAIFVIAVIMTAFSALLQFDSTSLAFSQAIDLLPIDTGNKTLDSHLPVFFKCIEEAVDDSENAPQQDSYFEDEPTKNEVRVCYQAVLIDNPMEDKDNNDMEDEEAKN